MGENITELGGKEIQLQKEKEFKDRISEEISFVTKLKEDLGNSKQDLDNDERKILENLNSILDFLNRLLKKVMIGLVN